MYLHHSDVFSALDAVSWKATGKDQWDGETTPEWQLLLTQSYLVKGEFKVGGTPRFDQRIKGTGRISRSGFFPVSLDWLPVRCWHPPSLQLAPAEAAGGGRSLHGRDCRAV